MSINPADILAHIGGNALTKYGTLTRRVTTPKRGGESGAEVFTRTGTAYGLGRDGYYYPHAGNVLRHDFIDGDFATVVELAATNQLKESSSFLAASTDWLRGADFTVATATSRIKGQTGHRHTGLGVGVFKSRDQVVGTFDGNWDTFWVLIEPETATECTLAIWDDTLGSAVYRTRFTYGTETWSTIDGTGTPAAKEIASGVWLLQITANGTSGNTRRMLVYPTGTAINTDSAILHHAQLEDTSYRTSPIVTTTAPDTRNDETLYVPLGYSPAGMQVYLKHLEVAGVSITDGALWGVTNEFSHNPRVVVNQNTFKYRVYHHNGVTSESSPLVGVPTVFQWTETLATLFADGSVQIEQSIEGGASETSTASNALALADQWSGQRLYLSSAGDLLRSANAYRTLMMTRGTTATLDDFRAIV